MDVLLFFTLVVSAAVGCGEMASVALVHPVIRRLSEDAQLVMEQGLLRTFGLVMPLGMTVAPVLAWISAARSGNDWYVSAGVVLTLALVITLLGNVPINLRTLRIRQESAPEGFIPLRRRWDVFQLLRGSLQFLGFVLICAALATGVA